MRAAELVIERRAAFRLYIRNQKSIQEPVSLSDVEKQQDEVDQQKLASAKNGSLPFDKRDGLLTELFSFYGKIQNVGGRQKHGYDGYAIK